jgi:hypothetical protein
VHSTSIYPLLYPRNNRAEYERRAKDFANMMKKKE